MGVSERRIRERLDARQSILATARELFLLKGFEATTIRNIAEKIEYSPSTIYQHFKDKNEIFYTIHSESFAELVRYLNASEMHKNPMDQLIALGQIYIQFALKNPELYDLMFIMEAPIDFLDYLEDANWTEGKMAFDYLKSVIANCIQQGLIKETDLESLSYLIWSTVHGLVTISIRKRGLKIGLSDPDTIIQRSFAIFSHLLVKS
ncbi:MAG: TetR/AcrR family transcriptional regulator [Saprospiraceae bacterium]|nr:TetR/AcrR family transcriptional regulator [Saprospiraceae bacterium]MDP4811359.1 TetR/AcrR family transcriptional regulator [Saprospiraceae bacterium]MDP4853634.1 TetR/AcrR family transcriptional regulator [Saprospiraceae bacterium]MDP4916034.1 TetR/AcrR family transcriptional regulator [Saprospiraceae bacterium]MDP5049283.1 TetR/AcrR family transcriptional regulator [Saprospiraceae bacterium]